MTYGEIIVSVLIVALMLFATWRAGQTNPVGTGSLVRRLTTVEHRMEEVDARLSNVEGSVEKLADASDAINTALSAMRLEMAGDRGVSERTWAAVDRMQQFFIDQALDQAFGRKDRA